jgi:hypothetical protein
MAFNEGVKMSVPVAGNRGGLDMPADQNCDDQPK